MFYVIKMLTYIFTDMSIFWFLHFLTPIHMIHGLLKPNEYYGLELLVCIMSTLVFSASVDDV